MVVDRVEADVQAHHEQHLDEVEVEEPHQAKARVRVRRRRDHVTGGRTPFEEDGPPRAPAERLCENRRWSRKRSL